jgi:protease-4
MQDNNNLEEQPNNQQQNPSPKRPWQEQYADFPQKSNRPKSSSWWKPVLIILGVIFFVFIGFIGLVIYGVSQLNIENAEVKEVTNNSILVVDLSVNMGEHNETNDLGSIFSEDRNITFYNTLLAIGRAGEDDRIKGIYLKPIGNIGMAKSVELHDALMKFKEKKKFIYVYSMALDENAYYNALPADSIFMPEEGMLELNGFISNPVYFKGLFDKIGVEFTTIQFEDFKSAGESFSRRNMSDSAKLEYRELINHKNKVFTEAVSKIRKIENKDLNNYLEKGVYLAKDAKNKSLIDGYFTETEFKDFLKQRLYGDKAEDREVTYIDLAEYPWESVEVKGNKLPDNKRIALVNTVGEISNSLSSEDYEGIKAKTVIKQLREIAEDEEIGAVVLRIDSPGGSALASDEIWKEINILKKKKPVIASMGNVAASGGYYMAMACDTIVAHPSTITGSIGVILSIPNFTGLMNKLDITTDSIRTTSSADFLNLSRPLTAGDKARLTEMGENFYKTFVTKAAQSRGKSYEEMRSVAKGRVWTGEAAKEKGIVDVLGGLQDAINLAKVKMGFKAEDKAYIDIYPKKSTFFERFSKSIKNSSGKESMITALAKYFGFSSSTLETVIQSLPVEIKNQINYALKLATISKEEKVLYSLPNVIEIK